LGKCKKSKNASHEDLIGVWQEATAGSIKVAKKVSQVEGSEYVKGRELRMGSRPVKDQLPILPER
jgi:hypothetical protein